MPSVSTKDRQELTPIITTVECPICKAKPGEPCVYKKTTSPLKRKGAHDARFFALKKTKRADKKPSVVSKYGNVPGRNVEDLRPLASRRLTMREMRDCGAWVPLEEERD